jgi:hypothetical protein
VNIPLKVIEFLGDEFEFKSILTRYLHLSLFSPISDILGQSVKSSVLTSSFKNLNLFDKFLKII